MTQGDAIHLAVEAMLVTLKLAAPILLASLVVGLVVSLFQSVTQLQEFTLTFVPKLAAVAIVLLIAGHWMLGQLVGYTDSLFTQIPQLLGG
ncbi:MAG: flagellar biosynthesis protein FliQ [Actinomycetota bacterium]|jgi:flagellar biosynthetic protein FliQ|nr:flagellar biosynthesis protein FliQ [Actinomycetota bacterium]